VRRGDGSAGPANLLGTVAFNQTATDRGVDGRLESGRDLATSAAVTQVARGGRDGSGAGLPTIAHSSEEHRHEVIAGVIVDAAAEQRILTGGSLQNPATDGGSQVVTGDFDDLRSQSTVAQRLSDAPDRLVTVASATGGEYFTDDRQDLIAVG